jgi:hypothetical protein
MKLGASFSPPIVHCSKHEHAQPPARDHPDCPDPPVTLDWNDTLPVLKVKDVRGLLEALKGDSEGRRRPLWIWTMNTGAGDGAVRHGMKVRTHQAIPFARAEHIVWQLSGLNSVAVV